MWSREVFHGKVPMVVTPIGPFNASRNLRKCAKTVPRLKSGDLDLRSPEGKAFKKKMDRFGRRKMREWAKLNNAEPVKRERLVRFMVSDG